MTDVKRAADHMNVMAGIAKTKPTKQPKAKKSGGGIKRTKADAAFSDCVRERAGWCCERCGGGRYEPPTSALHCAHFFGRGKWGTRHDPDNADALCYGCHQYFGAHPLEFAEWKLARIGQERMDILREKSNSIELAKAAHKGDKSGEIAEHYKTELEELAWKRAAGRLGRVEFIGYI